MVFHHLYTSCSVRKILISAYAVSPDHGSEPGLGWNWCVRLAETNELFIITEGEFRDRIEAALPKLAQGKNMHFYYNPVSDRVRRMCWNQGDWRFYFHYRRWQRRTLEIARGICRDHPIDIIHHLNMIGFREPGFLWKIPDIPYVHGPINCKFEYPMAFWRDAPLKERLVIRIKDIISLLQMKYMVRFHRAIRRADVVLTANSDSRSLLKKYLNRDSYMLNEAGADSCGFDRKGFSAQGLNILWVGRLSVYSKLPGLALRAVSLTSDPRITIHFVGAGDDKQYREMAHRLAIESRCFWHGALPHQEVLELMRTMDVLLMTSVVEGTPHVVLEAVASGLPVVCLDTCGQGDIVNSESGVKIALTDLDEVSRDIAGVLDSLNGHPDILEQLSKGCMHRIPELSWDAIVNKMQDIYEKITS